MSRILLYSLVYLTLTIKVGAQTIHSRTADTVVQANGQRIIYAREGYENPNAPYLQQSPGILPTTFRICIAADSSVLTAADLKKGLPVLIAYINPDCSHCIKEAIELRLALDSGKLGNLQVVLVAARPEGLKSLVKSMLLDRHPAQLHVGREEGRQLMDWYHVQETPLNAWYDAAGRLVHHGVQDFDIKALEAWVKDEAGRVGVR